MKAIKKLPALDWDEIAKNEIVVTGENLVERSDIAFQIGRVAIAGLIYHSYLSPPWFWFALAKGVTLRDLIDFRRYQNEIPSGALTAVNESRAEAIRFAKFYGFEDTGGVRVYDGTRYKIFRRV